MVVPTPFSYRGPVRYVPVANRLRLRREFSGPYGQTRKAHRHACFAITALAALAGHGCQRQDTQVDVGDIRAVTNAAINYDAGPTVVSRQSCEYVAEQRPV